MSINLQEARNKIRRAGELKVRVVPMPGQPFTGDHQIEVNN